MSESFKRYEDRDPPRAEIEALAGPTLLEFGSNTCGICSATQPRVQEALAAHAGVRHVKIEDGRGRRLGRSFGVKLWPTLVLLREGREVGRLVRPHNSQDIAQALAALQTPA
jgi:thioredoxin 1